MSSGPTYSYVGVPIHAVVAERHVYDSYPSCQRDYVWSKGMQQKLVDSILRGLPKPPITVLPASEHDLMGTRYWIVDGQQRLKTILRFRDGEFKTATSFSLEPGVRPIEPGRNYSELTAAARSDFDFYQLQFCFIKNVESQATGLIYRRFNYQVKLKFAEALYSYESKAKLFAESLYDHGFWDTIYRGKKDRKQVFMMAIHIMFMEIMGVFANMTSPRLADMARGSKDDELVPDLTKRIKVTLSGLENVFSGAEINSTSEIIPIYQAGLLLQNDGYDLSASMRGCLAHWYMRVKEQAIHSRSQGISDPIGILANVNRQRQFWIMYLDELYSSTGLFRRDQRRQFTQLDKINAWMRQNGKCPVCSRTVQISEVGHHSQAHSSGGQTTSANCVLIHDECHQRLHSNPELPLDRVDED